MIDEKKLIEETQKYFVNNLIHKNDLAEVIANLPKVGEWIPCSERLPEESGKYLGQRPHGEIIDITFSKKHQKWNANDSCPPKYAMEIVAWMPLPEPYKKGDE